jgi:two-component sensor histidine kinase
MSIARKYVVYTFLMVLGLGCVFTPIKILFSHRQETEKVAEQIIKIHHSHLPFLVSSLWLTNYELLQKQIDIIVQFPYIDRVEVVDDEGRLFYTDAAEYGAENIGRLDKHTDRLTYTYKDANVEVGVMNLYINKDRIRRDVIRAEIPLMIHQFGTAMVLALIISLMFHRMVGRHLQSISEFLRVGCETSLKRTFSFEEKKNRNDELDRLAEAVNTMRSKLRSHIEEKELLIKEVHHRIKNNMASVQGLLRLQAETINNPEASKALIEAESRLHGMGVLYDKLYRQESVQSMSIKKYFPPLLEEILRLYPGMKNVSLETDIDDRILEAKLLASLGIMLNELVTNSLKHAFPETRTGTIRVELKSTAPDRVEFTYRDNGIGMPDSVLSGGTAGLGMMIIRGMAEQIGGTLKISRESGTLVTMVFKTAD